MAARHQIDVVRLLFLQFQKDVCELFHSHCFSHSLPADFPVLAKYTAQSTAGKEHRSGTMFAGNARLLPWVQGCSGDSNFRAAVTKPHAFFPISTASSGAEYAVCHVKTHDSRPSKSM